MMTRTGPVAMVAMKTRLTRLTYGLATPSRPGRRHQAALTTSPLRGAPVNGRLNRLVSTLAALAALAAAFGAGTRWLRRLGAGQR